MLMISVSDNFLVEAVYTKPGSLEIQRAKCGNVANIEKYSVSLEEVVKKYKLQDKHHLIFNMYEKGITQNHKPRQVVSGI
jgi:hypothetical protein